jgi:uncharacterized protein (DUF3084 family)
MSKFETESAVRDRMNEMAERMAGSEAEIKSLYAERQTLKNQVEELKCRLQELVCSSNNERKIKECETAVVSA